MTVDGAKALTSKGQQDWYGTRYMNRKFEQENTSSYNFMLNKKKIQRPPQGRVALEDWCEEVQTSSWATRTDDAHAKYMSMYANEVESMDHLEHVANSHKPG